jgi:hypothetical protein
MDPNLFYSRTIKGRLKLLKRCGEFISRIRYYGFNIELYTMDGSYVEVYYNRYTDKLDAVDMIDATEERLNRYAVGVNLGDLFNSNYKNNSDLL